jgi:hypothetical protein
MRITRLYAWLLLATALLAGCSGGITEVLFNNTEKHVRVYSDGKWLEVPPKTLVSFRAGVSDEISFVIADEAGTWGYDAKGLSIPVHFLSGDRMHIHEYLQLQSDHSVYLVEPKSSYPVTNFPEQPHGYPLSPKKVKFDKASVVRIEPAS